MNTQLLQNSDVLMRVLLLFVPTAVAFLVAIIYLFISQRKAKNAGLNSDELKNSTQLFLSVCATNFFYSIVEILLMLSNETITLEKITGVAVAMFALIGALNAASCIAKGIIGGQKLPYCAGEEKQNGLSKALLYMAAVEILGVIALAIYLIKFAV